MRQAPEWPLLTARSGFYGATVRSAVEALDAYFVLVRPLDGHTVGRLCWHLAEGSWKCN